MLWTFDKYRLDTENATLWNGDERVDLRPKTFDVLRFLVEHAGELVRKETLLESVWENTYVVEGVLTTSMSELRKVFGDTAKDQRFIATVYRRGYRFIAPVETLAADTALATAAPTSATAPSTGSARLSSLPRQRGFIGRELECEKLVDQLATVPECRILTLIGPGGIGKTSFAVAIAQQLNQLDEQPFGDGYFFVPLQAIRSGEEVFTAIADIIDLRLSGEESQAAQIQDFLSDKQLLLVLDNFEHLLEHQRLLSGLISAAPRLKILVTSREALNLEDAWFHPVDGLDYGDPTESDAVRMFAARAIRNQPQFDLDEKRAAVMRICRLVEGMPLALELAAGWLKMLSLDEVADEIEKGIDILADQFDDDGHRHGSIRAVIIETWQRLTEAERTLLKQFSLFRGGTSRQGIAEITGAGLPILARLVNKALLHTNRKLRYRMHELIRQFAAEELAADQTLEIETRDRHADYYLRHMGLHIVDLRSSRQAAACGEIQSNFENNRIAWRWAVERKQIDLLAGAIRSMSLFCDLRGHVPEGLALFNEAQAVVEASDHPERDVIAGRIKLRSAILNFRLSRYDTSLALFRQACDTDADDYECALALRYLGDYHFSHAGHISAEQARQSLEQCIELCEKIGDKHLHTECLIELTVLYTNLILDIELSQECAAQAVVLAREIGRPDLLGSALDVLAWTANHRGDYEAAENIWREVFEIASNSGNRAIEALATNWLGWSAWCVGGDRLAEAAELYIDARHRYEELGDRANVAMTCADLATVLLESGKLQAAGEQCRRGLEMAAQIGRDDHYVYNLYVLGAVETAAGNFDTAREHLQQARVMAWEQEEQTNKPVVVYYQAQLCFRLCVARRDQVSESELESIALVLLFLEQYPPTWQAFKDRAALLLAQLETEFPHLSLPALRQKSYDEIKQAALDIVPVLLDTD